MPHVLELRVHGVHNTPPQSMLGVTAAEIGQVAGDGLTGIFRTKDGKVPLRDLGDNIAVEAYSWGALTSSIGGLLGWARRVAWMFLLPFALLNLAYWARPELGFRTHQKLSLHAALNAADQQALRDKATDTQSAAKFSAGLLRVAALLLTTFMVLTPLTIGVDLLAWQCFRGGTEGCPSLPGTFGLLGGEIASSAAQRLAMGSLPALLVIVVLWALARQSLARYEEVEEPGGLAASQFSSVVLRHPDLWSGVARTQRLHRLHTAFVVCVVVCYTGFPAWFIRDTPPDRSWWTNAPAYLVLGFVDLLAIVLALTLVVQVALIQREDIESGTPAMTTGVSTGWKGTRLLRLSWCVLGAHLAVLWFADFTRLNDATQALLGENVWFIAVFVGVTCLHIMIFLVGRTSIRRSVIAGITTLTLVLLSSTRLTGGLPGWWVWIVPLGGIVLITAGVLWLARWHYRSYPGNNPSASASAWNGAGSSMFVAGSLWVALLFTTSVVTMSANYLNGPGNSVGDLRATLTPDAEDLTTRVVDKPVEAEGEVVVKGANILAPPDGDITIRLGSVKVESFHLLVADGEAVALPDQDLRGATLKLPAELEGRLDYVNSCVYKMPARGTRNGLPLPCTGITATTRSHSGTLAALKDDAHLVVGSAERPVRIRSANPPQVALTLPPVLVWAPLGQLVWAVLVALVAGLSWRRLRRPPVSDAVRDQVAIDGNVSAADEEVCRQARITAMFPHRAERLLDLVGRITVGVSIGLMLGSLTGEAPWQLPGAGWTASFATAGLWAALGTSAGLLWLASQLRKSESARKAVGILWDLSTFWPRAAHPFAPPCYAERVVPELLTRIKWAVREGADGGGADLVILSGHSQGSTLLVAAASRLRRSDLRKLRVITYGSQLRTWYGRIFPAIFGPHALGNISTDGSATFGQSLPDAPAGGPPAGGFDPNYTTALKAALKSQNDSLLYRLDATGNQPRWVNLFRRTDPLGFRVFSDDDHRGQDTYVLEVPTRAEGDPGPTVMTHGGYPHSIEYRETVASWTGEQVPSASKPRIAKPPFLPKS
jgi:hypothetical protein